VETVRLICDGFRWRGFLGMCHITASQWLSGLHPPRSDSDLGMDSGVRLSDPGPPWPGPGVM